MQIRKFALLLFLSSFLPIGVKAQTMSALDTIPDSYRHFVMPTAKPIEGGYVGFWELAFLQAGFGVEDVFSISGGFTVMPTVAFRSQFAFVQAKATLFDESGLSFAVGGNFLRLTSEHLYTHLMAIGTYEMPTKTRFTGMFFYKMTGDDFPVVNVVPFGAFGFNYGGPIGLGAGFDMPFSGGSNMRLVGELWNHDIQTPSKLMGLLALRVQSEKFSSDFGFVYFTLPIIAPVANFVYRF